MRILHLIRLDATATVRGTVERQVASGNEVTVVLAGPEAAFPETPGVHIIDGPGRSDGCDAGDLHDLLFEHDRVVSW